MNESLWLDEATTALVSRMTVKEIFVNFLPGDFHPPLYYLFMKCWVSLFGSSEIALRTPSVIFALLSVYLVYKMWGRISALLLATAPLLFYYAQEARMYVMTMFFVTLAVFSFVKTQGNSKVGWWIIFSFSLFLIGATDYVALLIIPVFLLLGRRKWKKLIMSHIILLGFYVLWLPYLLRQLSSGFSALSSSPSWGNILGASSFKNIFLIPVKFAIGRVSFEEKGLYALIVGFVLSLFAYLIYKSGKKTILYWSWITVPIILGFIIGFKVPIVSYFRFLFILPAFYILIARGVEKAGKAKKIFLLSAVFLNLIFIAYYLLNPGFHREDWRGAAEAVGKKEILMPADSQKEALIYYGKGEQIVTEPKGEEVWLSRYVWDVFDPDDKVRINLEALGYNKVQELSFNGVVFWKYLKNQKQ